MGSDMEIAGRYFFYGFSGRCSLAKDYRIGKDKN
jgi:hypothetical protein